MLLVDKHGVTHLLITTEVESIQRSTVSGSDFLEIAMYDLQTDFYPENYVAIEAGRLRAAYTNLEDSFYKAGLELAELDDEL